MRTCIKCGRELPLGMFDDNWRHKVNVCKDCKRKYQKEYERNNKRTKLQRRLSAITKEAEQLKARLYGE